MARRVDGSLPVSWTTDKLQQRTSRARSSATHVRAASAERHPSTEAPAHPLLPEIERRRSMEEEPGRGEGDARFRRRSAAAAPLRRQLRMKLLLFEEGATNTTFMENRIDNTRFFAKGASDAGAARGGGVEPHDAPLSPGNDFTIWTPSAPTPPPPTLTPLPGNTSPARRLEQPSSLRARSAEDGGTPQRQRSSLLHSPVRSVSWDSEIEDACIIPGRQHDAPRLPPPPAWLSAYLGTKGSGR